MSQVIVVGGTKGGPGKSTIAQQITACLILKRKVSAHLLDIDIQQTSISWCEDRRKNDDLPLIPHSFAQDDVIKHIKSLKGSYDYIVVDAGGFDSDVQRYAMLMADYILIPLRPKRRDLKSLRNIDPMLESVLSSNSDVKVFTVMNQCPSLPSQAQRILMAKGVTESFGLNTLPVNIYTRNVYDDAEEAGRSIFEMKGGDKDKKAEAEIESLVQSMLFPEEVKEA